MFIKKCSKLLGSSMVYPRRLQYNPRFYFMGGQKFDARKNYYQTLGVNKDASEAQIKREYYKLAKLYHPDHNKGAQAKFKQISEAYEVLSNKAIRTEYDSNRIFGSFRQNMSRRASSGNYRYNDYKDAYRHEFTEEEQQMIRRQMRKMFRVAILFGLGLVFFSMMFIRTPNRFYTDVGGKLVPVDPHTVAAQMAGGSAYGGQYGGNYPPPQSPYGGVSGGYYNRPMQHQPQYQSQYQNQYPNQNQGGYTQFTAPPNQYAYSPASNQSYQPSAYSRNPQEPNYNPRMQSNYQNRSGSAPTTDS